MPGSRAKPSQATEFADLAAVLASELRKASADGGQRSTATIEAQEKAIKSLTEALESREAHVKQLQTAVDLLLCRLGEHVTTSRDLALINANKETALAELQGKENFRTELVKQLGPVATGPVGLAILGGLLAKAGMPINIGGPDPTKSDGTPTGDKKAAAWSTVQTIVTDEEIRSLVIARVGEAQWAATVDFFLSMANSAGPSAPANGVNVN